MVHPEIPQSSLAAHIPAIKHKHPAVTPLSPNRDPTSSSSPMGSVPTALQD